MYAIVVKSKDGKQNNSNTDQNNGGERAAGNGVRRAPALGMIA